MTKKDFKGKKITIMGLGLNRGGLGAALFFAKLGAKVLVTDIKKKQDLEESIKKLKDLPIEYVLGQHRPEDFKNTDMVIKNPAVSSNSKYLEIARENKVPIYSDIGIFLKLCKSPIIAITGTKGKSTTSSMLYQMLKKQYENVILAGNIRISVLLELKKIKKNSLVVLELSSWQLEDLGKIKFKPHVAVITNIFSDHLDKHKNFKDYVKAKKNIYKHQDKNDFLILNRDNKTCRKLAKKTKSKVIFFSTKSDKAKGAQLIGKNIVFGPKKEFICTKENINPRGKHNLSNALAAMTVSKIYNVKTRDIKRIIKTFTGLKGRLEFIVEFNSIKFYNDTCATQPDATIVALKVFKKPLILIAGGADKRLEFRGLGKWILKKVKILILLPGDGSDKIKRIVKKLDDKYLVYEVKNMFQAVELATQKALPKDVVLLSPACASFSGFKHEFHRGDEFNKSVQEIVQK